MTRFKTLAAIAAATLAVSPMLAQAAPVAPTVSSVSGTSAIGRDSFAVAEENDLRRKPWLFLLILVPVTIGLIVALSHHSSSR